MVKTVAAHLFLVYLIMMNLGGFASMAWDKHCAKTGRWRVKEKTLFLWALCGGALGSWLGMKVCRHKTKHWYFVLGIPLCGVADALLLFALSALLRR